MGTFSIWHWIIVLIIVLLLFGKGKIPSLMADMAKGIKSFKSNMAEDEKPANPDQDNKDNQSVNVVIRPEAIKLSQEKSPLLNPNTGVVVDSKFLGNSAIIHMTVNDQLNKKHHIHSKVIGNFLPPAASSVSITLDQSHIFVFPR